eukprot:s3057_g1.t1
MFKLGAFDSFLAGAGVVILVNIALLLQGGSPLGFDREEFERQLEVQGLKAAGICGTCVAVKLTWGPWMIWMVMFWKVLKGSGRFQVVREVLLFWQFW